MKKVGILALGKAENYGAVLQSYALCKYINNNFCEAEIIDYTSPFLVGRYRLFSVNTSGNIAEILKSFCFAMLIFGGLLRKRIKFIMFRKRDSLYSAKKYRHLTNNDYSKYIVGSDQVFNLELTNNDLNFFLPGVENVKKYTFAASIGVSALTNEQKEIFAKNLKLFNKISLREKTAKDIMENVLKRRDLIQLLDPVFLISSQEWKNLVKTTEQKEYILIYTFKGYEFAHDIANELDANCRIYYINNDFRKYTNGVYNKAGVGPIDFLRLIINASIVITDSFHGTAFSIIFNKEFYAINYPGTESRIKDMLDYFGLGERLISSCNSLKNIKTIDYDDVNVKIEQNRIDSSKFLSMVLEV